MKRRTFFRWFFFPAAMSVGLIGCLFLWLSTDLGERLDFLSGEQRSAIDDVSRVTELNERLARLHGDVMETLTAAADGRIDEEKVYEAHRHFLDGFAVMRKEVADTVALASNRFDNDAEVKALGGLVQASFDSYANQVGMATEIASVDTRTASRHMQEAWTQYLTFSKYLQTLRQQHLSMIKTNMGSVRRIFDGTITQVAAVVAVFLLAVLGLSYAVSTMISGKLDILTDAMAELSGKPERDPDMTRVTLLSVTDGGLGDLAKSVLAFHDTLGALKHNEGRLSHLVDAIGSAGIGIFVADPHCRLRYMNQQMQDWFGDRSGSACNVFESRGCAEGLGCGLKAGKAEAEAGQHRAINRDLDGRIFDVLSIPFHDYDGDRGRLVLVRDVTAEITAEEKLKDMFETMSNTLAELERFTFVAAHDLQEPLRLLMLYSQKLERDFGAPLPAAAREDLDIVSSSAARMRNLVSDLLLYAGVQTDSSTFKPVDLSDVASTALKLSAAAIQDSKAEIDLTPLPIVQGDAAHLSSVFVHLLSNAVKFRKAGIPPRIRLSAQRDEDRWIISVQDNGIGIAAEHHDKIFDIFRRLNAPQNYSGTGLGLAMARRIIERHGGRIWVDAAYRDGCRIQIALPAPGSISP